MTRLRAAVVQAETPSDLTDGLSRTAGLVRDAAAKGAELVAFPEAWLSGYPAWLDHCRDAALWDHPPVKRVYARMVDNSVAVPGDASAALAQIARDSGVTLVVGVSERVEVGPGRGTLYNAVLTYGPDGALLNHHRKLLATYSERMVWGHGDAFGLRAVPTRAGKRNVRIGALICWEHWMPLARQALHESGEDVHVALWPTVHEMHQVASRQYAFEGRCYVLAAGSLMRAAALPAELEPHPGKVSGGDQWLLRGGSAIIGPDGAYLADPVYDTATTIMADLDLGRLAEERLTLDVTGHYARPDVFEFRVVSRERPRPV
ncbi:MAG: carbon-nitrogen hydrolase family protein [Gemmatimonadales bacterium]